MTHHEKWVANKGPVANSQILADTPEELGYLRIVSRIMHVTVIIKSPFVTINIKYCHFVWPYCTN